MLDHQLRSNILVVKTPLVLTDSCDLDTGNVLLAKRNQTNLWEMNINGKRDDAVPDEM